MNATTTARPLAPRQLDSYRFGLGLFLLAEGVLFLTLFSIRLLLVDSGPPEEMNQVAGGALTLLMWLSVVPALDALRAARRGDDRQAARSLLVTAFLGVLLVAGIAVEWITIDLPAGNRFGGIFLTAYGAHGVHVVAAVAVLVGLAAQARQGRFTPANHFAVEAGVVFWLFIVGVWVVLWAVFYLLTDIPIAFWVAWFATAFAGYLAFVWIMFRLAVAGDEELTPETENRREV